MNSHETIRPTFFLNINLEESVRSWQTLYFAYTTCYNEVCGPIIFYSDPCIYAYILVEVVCNGPLCVVKVQFLSLAGLLNAGLQTSVQLLRPSLHLLHLALVLQLFLLNLVPQLPLKSRKWTKYSHLLRKSFMFVGHFVWSFSWIGLSLNFRSQQCIYSLKL